MLDPHEAAFLQSIAEERVMDDNCISRPTTTGFPDPV